MKKTVIALITLLSSLSASAQTVNGVPIKDIDIEFVQIVGTVKAFSSKTSVELDFGQEKKFLKSSDTQIRDADNKAIIFNSMIDALNFMSKLGYEFVDSYSVQLSGQTLHYYLLRKKKP